MRRPTPRTVARSATFSVAKTIYGFDVAGSSVPRATFDYLASLEWIRAHENLALVGPPGTGKSSYGIKAALEQWPRVSSRSQ